MSERVIITLDVTMNEGREIADLINGVSPFYEDWSLHLVLDQVARLHETGKTRAVYLRSDASAALGGPDGAAQPIV